MHAGGRAWGNGDFGKLGLGDTAKRTSPARLATDAFGGLQVLQAACGDEHTLAAWVTGTKATRMSLRGWIPTILLGRGSAWSLQVQMLERTLYSLFLQFLYT